jgi:lipid-A-disaccharide synthase
VRIGFVAGETSGDQLGAGLIQELRKSVPDLHCEGVAGPLMQNAGCEAWEAAEALAVMGLIEPLREIPRLLRLRRTLLRRWTSRPPDVFVGIDAPDFNLGLECKLREAGIKTVHYVSPSVWAWRQGRMRKIKKAADTVLCLLPFEKKFYDEHGIAAVFVGHPLAESMPKDPDMSAARAVLGIRSKQVVAILPGSRHSEVSRLAGPFAATCRMLLETNPSLTFVAPMAGTALRAVFERHLREAGVRDAVCLTDGKAPLAISAADVVLLASGTATLQTALLGKPMVVAYRVAPLTGWIAKKFGLLKTSWFSLPNLLTPEPMVPELMQGDATPLKLHREVSLLLDDADRRRRIAAVFADLRVELSQDANRLAARAVLDLVGHPAGGGESG